MSYWVPRAGIPTPVFSNRQSTPSRTVDRRSWYSWQCPNNSLVSKIVCRGGTRKNPKCLDTFVRCKDLTTRWRTTKEIRLSPGYVTGRAAFGGRFQHCPRGYFLKGITCTPDSITWSGRQSGLRDQQKTCSTIEMTCVKVQYFD